MKWIGILFIVVSAWSVGYRTTRNMTHRCRNLRNCLHALQVLRNEIAFIGTPLPQAVALMAVACQGRLADVLTRTAQDMDRCPWKLPVEALRCCDVPRDLEEDLSLEELFCGLGKYDLEAQLGVIERVSTRVGKNLEELDQDRKNKGRTYETLGICAGLSVAILLL